MNRDRFITRLAQAEPDAVVRVMAFMSYNPSIGRVLQGGGVKKFERVARRLVRGLSAVRSRRDFDCLHQRYVRQILTTFRTSRGRKPSYGQAAKPINVFLKVYLDWAGLPNPGVRRRVLPFLHVPLDSVLMGKIKQNDAVWYREKIWPHVKGEVFPHSLSLVDQDVYWEWQNYFRARWSKKPLLFDVAWAIYRDSTS
jgi:hypothetical protein